MNACTIHGLITTLVCRRCNPNGITPAMWLARGFFYLLTLGIIVSLIAAPFLFTESEIKQIGSAIYPLIIYIGLFLVPCAGLGLVVSLQARNVRKLK